MADNQLFSEKVMETLLSITNAGIHNAARGFSSLLGHKIDVSAPSVKVVSLFDIPEIMGGPETEAVGIYLRAEGDLCGQIMMVVPYTKSLELVDLLMEVEPGTTRHLGKIERSALAEVGNMTGTYFMNAVAELTNTSIRPSPPAVMVDMIGAIIDIIIATSGGVSDKVLLMQADFMDGGRLVETNFWVIPDIATLKAFQQSGSIHE